MTAHRKPLLLIVDDDLPTLQLYQRELGGRYQVLICQEFSRAAELLHMPGLQGMVLEPTISEGDGWKLLPALRAVQIPVVLCSSSDEKGRGLAEGAAAVLIKPVLPALLMETLRKVIPTMNVRS
jgi:DNA-binding response OmpR family regulator